VRTSNVVILYASAFLAAVLFWPTLYRYDKDQSLGVIVRTNRLTGRTTMLWGGNWIPTPGGVGSAKPSVELPESELAKLAGNAGISEGRFRGKIYNGSNWRIERVYLVVAAKKRDGRVGWTREVSTTLDADPLDTGSFSLPVTGEEDIGSTDWKIERAFGYKSDTMPTSSARYKFRDGPDGLIRFPASMSDEEIDKAVKKLYLPKSPKQRNGP
jgi:hypothetical protein